MKHPVQTHFGPGWRGKFVLLSGRCEAPLLIGGYGSQLSPIIIVPTWASLLWDRHADRSRFLWGEKSKGDWSEACQLLQWKALLEDSSPGLCTRLLRHH